MDGYLFFRLAGIAAFVTILRPTACHKPRIHHPPFSLHQRSSPSLSLAAVASRGRDRTSCQVLSSPSGELLGASNWTLAGPSMQCNATID